MGKIRLQLNEDEAVKFNGLHEWVLLPQITWLFDDFRAGPHRLDRMEQRCDEIKKTIQQIKQIGGVSRYLKRYRKQQAAAEAGKE